MNPRPKELTVTARQNLVRTIGRFLIPLKQLRSSRKLDQNLNRMEPMTRSTTSADEIVPTANRIWPKSTTLFLIFVGVALALFSFVVVINMPLLAWPATNEADLQRTIDSFRETGSLLLPETPTSVAGWGSIVVASVLSALVGTSSPHAVLGIVQATVVAIPLVWLPLCVARIFRRARAGYALVLLPPLIWLLNSGTILVGTQYGLSDDTSPLRVSALYGLPASLAFLSLSLLLLFSVYRLNLSRRILASAGLAVLAGVVTIFDWYAGIGVALAISVLWWIRAPRGKRILRAFGAAAIAVVIACLTNFVLIGSTIGFSEATRFPTFAFDSGDSLTAVDVYFRRLLIVIKHFGAMISFILIGFVLALTRRAPQRRALAASFWIALPSLILGFMASVRHSPTLYAYSQLSATLGLLSAIALGAVVWSITSMPSHVRSVERSRLNGRHRNEMATASPLAPPTGLSVVVPTRNGADVLEETLTALGERLMPKDEVIVVENGSTDGTTELLTRISNDWSYASTILITHSDPGLGEALRKGVESSIGSRLLLTADDLPFGFTDLDEFNKLSAQVPVAIGSKAHPRSSVARSRLRTIQSRIFRFLRAALLQSRVGDSQGTLWVDGTWGRAFAHLSRESGLMWTTELVLAAEQQQITVQEVPVALSNRHETGASRFRVSDAWQSFVGFTRLAVYKDDYCNEEWVPSTRPADIKENTTTV